MIGNVQIRNSIQVDARDAIANIDNFTAAPAVVTLVEVSFDPKDPTTYPAASTKFAAKNAAAAAYEVFDVASGKWMITFPDPEGGWEFAALSITTPITVQGYIVTVDGAPIGGNTFVAKSVTATGQIVVLPYLAIELPTAPMPNAVTPASI